MVCPECQFKKGYKDYCWSYRIYEKRSFVCSVCHEIIYPDRWIERIVSYEDRLLEYITAKEMEINE